MVLEQYTKTRRIVLPNGDIQYKNMLHFERFGAHVEDDTPGQPGPAMFLPHGIYKHDPAVAPPWAIEGVEQVKPANGNPSCSQYSSDTPTLSYNDDRRIWGFTDGTAPVDGTLKHQDLLDVTIEKLDGTEIVKAIATLAVADKAIVDGRDRAPLVYLRDAVGAPGSPPIGPGAPRFEFAKGDVNFVKEHSVWTEHEFIWFGGEYSQLVDRVFMLTEFETDDIGVMPPHVLKIELWNDDTSAWVPHNTLTLPRYARGIKPTTHDVDFEYIDGESPSDDPFINEMNVIKFRCKTYDDAGFLMAGDDIGVGFAIDQHGSGYVGMAFMYEYYMGM